MVVAKDEIGGSQSIDVTRSQLGKHIRSNIEQLKPYKVNKNIKHDSIIRHTKDIIRRVNKVEENKKQEKIILQRERESVFVIQQEIQEN